jgi:hypothetical protein
VVHLSVYLPVYEIITVAHSRFLLHVVFKHHIIGNEYLYPYMQRRTGILATDMLEVLLEIVLLE